MLQTNYAKPTRIIQGSFKAIEKISRNIIYRWLLGNRRADRTVNLYADHQGVCLADSLIFQQTGERRKWTFLMRE